MIEHNFLVCEIYFLETIFDAMQFSGISIMALNHVKDIVFELCTKFGFQENSLAPKFDDDHEKLISKSTSASKITSDSLLKIQNSFPDMP